jgi:hypothetical protein
VLRAFPNYYFSKPRARSPEGPAPTDDLTTATAAGRRDGASSSSHSIGAETGAPAAAHVPAWSPASAHHRIQASVIPSLPQASKLFDFTVFSLNSTGAPVVIICAIYRVLNDAYFKLKINAVRNAGRKRANDISSRHASGFHK